MKNYSYLLVRSYGMTGSFWRYDVAMPLATTREPVAVANMKLTDKDTGAFKSMLPDVHIGTAHYKRALRSLGDIIPDKNIENLRNRNRKYAAQSLDTLMKGLIVPLTNIIKAYSVTMKSLHPFEATVANLTVISREKQGFPHLNTILKDVATLRKETSLLAKHYAAQAKKSDSILGASALLEEGKSELSKLYSTAPISACLTELYDLQRALRKIPVIELKTPSVVLVGAPNVGKSSIVREVSSGTPEVNNYPFTTRGVTVGHIINKQLDLRAQVMDTPGLLDRPEYDRNEMELLTYASMAHLPTAVVFVIDPTGLAGEKSTLSAQLNIRAHMRQRFPRRPWLDVVSKGDILIPSEVNNLLPSEHLRVSVVTKQGIEELKSRLGVMLKNDLVLSLTRADSEINKMEED